MIITPLESIGNLKKRMKKFNYASLYGTLIKYSSPFGVGHAYLVSYSKSSIIYNKDLKIEPLYEEISNFHTTESRTTIFQESETPSNEGRKRNTLGSLPTITAIFGLTIANEIIKRISKWVRQVKQPQKPYAYK